MPLPRKPLLLIILLLIIATLGITNFPKVKSKLSRLIHPQNPTIAQAPQPTDPKEGSYSFTNKVKYPEDYTTVLLGDSMTEALGNSDELKTGLKKYYPDKTFEFLNYGFGSTNLLSVEKRLTQKTFYTRDFRPILFIDFDLILIESFGNNPLSEYSLDEGLKKQNEELDKIISTIKDKNPRAKIVFVSTIAPNSKSFGTGQVELSSEAKAKWAAERTAYTKNHTLYAQTHNIPVIDIYTASIKNGDGNPDYINDKDHIHPSPTGVRFISQQIADFLYNQKILEGIKKN